ncbi:MAG: Fe-S cluster assembly sulfur transfer protein SufU [Kofleriaceae bacterium]
MTDPRALYHATIIDHDRHPRHEGVLAGATHAATVDNPLCGDVVTIHLVIDGPTVVAASFEARGCAVSRAAASIATTRAIGARPDDLRALATAFDRFVHAPVDAPPPAELGELEAFGGVRAVKSRRSCACLAFRALTAALGATLSP